MLGWEWVWWKRHKILDCARTADIRTSELTKVILLSMSPVHGDGGKVIRYTWYWTIKYKYAFNLRQ